MKIVFLDRKTIGEDIDLTGFEALGEVVTYEMSQPEEVPDWCGRRQPFRQQFFW